MAIQKGRLDYIDGQRIGEDELNSIAQQTIGFFNTTADRDLAYPNTMENPTPHPTVVLIYLTGTLQYWDGNSWEDL